MSSSGADAERPRAAAALLAVLLLVAVAFLPCVGNGFVDWDDDVVLAQDAVTGGLSPGALATMFLTTLGNSYQPLTFLAWAAGHSVWGASAQAFHLLSLALHLATVALVLRWVARLERDLVAAAVAALAFGVHPMRVEAVAWFADLKDVLAGFFAMAALLAHERWRDGGRPRWYAAALACFALAGLSKPTAATLPALLLLVDWLRRRPLDRGAASRSAPFFALAGVFAALAVLARSRFEGMIAEDLGQESYPAAYRLFIAGHRLVFYFLQRTVAPGTGIGNLYPDVVGGPYAVATLAWAAPLAVLATAVWLSARRTRKPAFGAGFFLIALAPGLATVSYGYSADRFAYLPSVGLAYLAGVGASAALRASAGRGRRLLLAAAALAAVVALGAASWRQCGVWRDGVSLWSDAVAHYRAGAPTANLGAALVNLGRARLAAGDPRGALRDLDEGLPLTPDRPPALYARGLALAALGERRRAADDLREVLRFYPGDATVRSALERLEAPEAP